MGAAVALVVHDLKNELGALEAALCDLACNPQPAAADAAHRLCRHLRQRLVMYLTLYGSDGDLRARCEDESPSELLAALVARHRDDHPHIELLTEAGPNPPPFWFVDRRQVVMALDAALHNALRFARSRVVLRLALRDDHLVFAIVDDGPGLDAERPADDSSTGLGTTLCRAVARAHGSRGPDGGVRLYNRPQGGACFELWLPT
jgi:signal transduction histidine kinase